MTNFFLATTIFPPVAKVWPLSLPYFDPCISLLIIVLVKSGQETLLA